MQVGATTARTAKEIAQAAIDDLEMAIDDAASVLHQLQEGSFPEQPPNDTVAALADLLHEVLESEPFRWPSIHDPIDGLRHRIEVALLDVPG